MAETAQEVIAFLSNGANYGLPRAEVARIETHCSIIFLIGNYAYKLKRPIAFSSLDYTTVDRRGAACRAELELNRRTAPELYLGIHTIRRRPNGDLAFDGEGQVLDWVVGMRRFDQADLFDHLADVGILSTELMCALADEIACFHGTAEHTAEFGGAAGLGRAIEHNRDDQQTVEAILPQDAVEGVHVASINALARVSHVLDRRRQEGWVRRCHGDLRLANICLVDGRPTLFDAIEFSDEFSCIDVLFDLAFLLMELHQRGLDFLANMVFNRYLDATGDANGLVALPLMLSIRAASRAYTLAFAVQRQTDREKAQRFVTAAQSHMALASSMLGTFPAHLVAIGGLSSSHKASVAHELSAAFAPAPGGRILRSDVVRKQLLGLPQRSRLLPTAYNPELNEAVYTALVREAKQLLATGFTVIIDASFMQPAHREDIAAVASSASVPFVGLWLGAPQDMAVGAAAPAATWQILEPGPTPAATIASARLFTNVVRRVMPKMSDE